MTICSHCNRPIEDDDGTWYHPDTMTARCDGPDDEEGLAWGDMVRQAEPQPHHAPTVTIKQTVDATDDDGWRVQCFDIVQEGEVVASLQITPNDMVVFALNIDCMVRQPNH